MARLIITADDFGLSESINEGVEIAFRRGILTTASLMVAAPAAAAAIARARRLPGLKVGLHLVLVEGRPASSSDQVSALLKVDGAFLDNLFVAGLRFFFHPQARRQLAVEIEAQFRAFAATGLELDHVNAHNHMHLHPTVLDLILKIGPQFGMRAMRVPQEPEGAIRGWCGRMARWGVAPWIWRLRVLRERR
ncbi:chitin disaccharide deacetylase [Azospirillaceae bacterium]